MDITERREIERRLHQQQEFARRLVDSFLISFSCSISAATTLRQPAFEGDSRLRAWEIAPSIRHCAHPEDMPAVHALYGDIVAGRQTFVIPGSSRAHKLGEWRRIRFNFSRSGC